MVSKIVHSSESHHHNHRLHAVTSGIWMLACRRNADLKVHNLTMAYSLKSAGIVTECISDHNDNQLTQ